MQDHARIEAESDKRELREWRALAQDLAGRLGASGEMSDGAELRGFLRGTVLAGQGDGHGTFWQLGVAAKMGAQGTALRVAGWDGKRDVADWAREQVQLVEDLSRKAATADALKKDRDDLQHALEVAREHYGWASGETSELRSALDTLKKDRDDARAERDESAAWLAKVRLATSWAANDLQVIAEEVGVSPLCGGDARALIIDAVRALKKDRDAADKAVGALGLQLEAALQKARRQTSRVVRLPNPPGIHEALQVGEVVRWRDVPDGATVRDEDGDLAVREGDRGRWLEVEGEPPQGNLLTKSWPWLSGAIDEKAMIVSLPEAHEQAPDFVGMLRAAVAEARAACPMPGDRVAWDKVPDGAMARDCDGDVFVRRGDLVRYLWTSVDGWSGDNDRAAMTRSIDSAFFDNYRQRADTTVLALSVPVGADAATLQAIHDAAVKS